MRVAIAASVATLGALAAVAFLWLSSPEGHSETYGCRFQYGPHAHVLGRVLWSPYRDV